MRLQINNKEVNIPSSLSEITLRQRIDYQSVHGDLLAEMQKSILETKDDEIRELELIELQFERMFRTVSFFTGFSVESLKESEYVDTLFNIYISSIDRVFEDEQQEWKDMKYDFVWEGEEWELHTPELKNGDRMTFGEFIDSKQMIQSMVGLGRNRWECLVPLCAIFLRKKGEPYKESFLYEDSERLRLMENLPLDIALQVGFFLSSSLTIFRKTFQSFSSPEQKMQEVT